MLKPLWKGMRYTKVHYHVNTIKTANIYHIAVPKWMDARVFDFRITLCGTLDDSEYTRTRVAKYITVRRPPRGRKLCRLCKANYKKLVKLLGGENAYFSESTPATTATWKRNGLAIRTGRFARKSRSGIKEIRDVFADYERARFIMGRLSRDFRCSNVS